MGLEQDIYAMGFDAGYRHGLEVSGGDGKSNEGEKWDAMINSAPHMMQGFGEPSSEEISPIGKAWDFLAKRSEEWGDMGAELARNPGPESDQPAGKFPKMFEPAGKVDPNQLAEGLAAARAKPPAKPLNLQKLPSMPEDPAQQQLPPELTAGATVADRDFRDVQFPRVRL